MVCNTPAKPRVRRKELLPQTTQCRFYLPQDKYVAAWSPRRERPLSLWQIPGVGELKAGQLGLWVARATDVEEVRESEQLQAVCLYKPSLRLRTSTCTSTARWPTPAHYPFPAPSASTICACIWMGHKRLINSYNFQNSWQWLLSPARGYEIVQEL